MISLVFTGFFTMFDDSSESARKRGSSVVRKEFESKNIKKSLNEFFFMSFGFLLVFLVASLFSYSRLDNSFFFFNSEKNTFDNVCGAFGAHCASALLFFLGSVSYFVVGVFIAAWVYRFSRPQQGNYMSWFAGGAAFFTVFMGLFVHLLSGSYALGAGKLSGVSLFDSMIRGIGPVGVGMGVLLGLLCSLAILFDMTVQQVLALGVLAFQVAMVALAYLAKKMRALSVRALHVGALAWEKLKTALTPVDENKTYEKRCEEQIVIHDPVFFSHDDSEIIEESEEHIERVSAFQPVQSKAVELEPDIIIPNLYEPSLERTFKFGSFTLNLFPVAPFCTNIFKHQEFIRLFTTKVEVPQFSLPDESLLIEDHVQSLDRAAFEIECKARAVQLEEKLKHFGVNGSVVAIKPGPVITLFEYQPGVDVKINSIIAREDDLAMVLKALSIRIVAPIPGTSVVGFEIANAQREDVFISDLIVGDAWKKSTAQLPLLLGVDITGNAVVQDLATMPHLLVAGSTGSGKSVCMHSLLFSLLSRHTPQT